MKLSCLQVFGAAAVLVSAPLVEANQKDDIEIVDRLLEHYPAIDLSKEANLQVQIVAEKYSSDLAALLNGKISYVTNQKSKARNHFNSIDKSSEYFAGAVLTYFELASDEKIKDSTGMKQAADFLVEHGIWKNYPDKDSVEFHTVKKILKAYGQFYRNDRSKTAILNKILKELDISVKGELESLISDYEKSFINAWSEKAGEKAPVKELEKILAKLEDLEFGEKTYEFFTAYPSRARVLTMLGRVDEALKLLDRQRNKIEEFDTLVKEDINKNRELSNEDRKKAFMQYSVMSQWYYAKGLSLFHKYRLNPKHESAAESLFGKMGSVVNFYYSVKKFPENSYSFKSIIAYQKIREVIDKRFSKKLKELTVSGLIQGKAFYSVEDYENAYKYLKEASADKDSSISYDAYNLLIGTAVKLEKWEESLAYFSEMTKKHSALNKAPKDHITKLTNYLVSVYLKESKKAEEQTALFENLALDVYRNAGKHGSAKSNTTIKYVLANTLFNKAASLKADLKKAEALMKDSSFLVDSLIKEHSLSRESAKIYKTLGLTYHSLGNFEKASDNIENYLTKIATFSRTPDEGQLKMRLLLSEILLNREQFSKARENLSILDGLISKSNLEAERVASLNENSAGVKVRLTFREINKLDQEKAAERYPEFIKLAESFIDKYQNSPSRPYIMAQVATLYQKMEQMDKANTIYTALQLEYPGHDAVERTSINQVMVMINERKGPEALHLLSSSDQLDKLSGKTLYSLLNQICDITDEFSQDDSRAVLKLLGKLDVKDLPKHADQVLALIEGDALINTGQTNKAEGVLKAIIKKNPRGAYIVDLQITYAKCLAAVGDFEQLSKVYSSLYTMVSRMNQGRGNANLTVRIASQFSSMFSKAKDEKHLKKGKSISFIASQYNPSIIDALSKVYLEESTYWNAWYSNKLKMDDFLDLKKDFLRRYPSSIFAPKLRKL